MITAIIFLLAGSVLKILGFLLNGLGSLMPYQFKDAVVYLFSNLNYFSGVFAVADLMNAFMAVLLVWISVYGVKVALWLLGFIPGFKHNPLPTHQNIDPHQGNVVNLKGRGWLNLRK